MARQRDRIGAPLPRAFEVQLERALAPMVRQVRAALPQVASEASAKALGSALKRQWSDERVRKIVAAIGAKAEALSSRPWGRLGVLDAKTKARPKPYDARALVDQWSKAAAAKIISVRSEVAEGLRRDVVEALERGQDPSELAARWQRDGIPVEFGTLEGRTRVIARHQLSVLHADVQRERARAIGVTEFVWRHSGKAKFRPEHKARDGRTFSYDTGAEGERPGQAVNCGCYAESVIPDEMLGGFGVGSEPKSAKAAPTNQPPPVRKPAPAPKPVPQKPALPPGQVMPPVQYDSARMRFVDSDEQPIPQAAVQRAADKIMGRRGVDLQELARLSGLDETAEVQFAVDKGAIVIQSKGAWGKSTRTIERDPENEGGVLLTAESFDVNADARGGGLGVDALTRLVEAAERLGVSRVATFAARGPNWNGYYTWPRLGYDGPVPWDIIRLRGQIPFVIPPEFADAKSVQDLIERPGGLDWWKAHGQSANLTFDVRAGSDSRAVLAAYRRAKGLPAGGD